LRSARLIPYAVVVLIVAAPVEPVVLEPVIRNHTVTYPRLYAPVLLTAPAR